MIPKKQSGEGSPAENKDKVKAALEAAKAKASPAGIRFGPPDAAQKKASQEFMKSNRGKVASVLTKAQHPLVHFLGAAERGIRSNPAVKAIGRSSQKRAVKAALGKAQKLNAPASGVSAVRVPRWLQGGNSERDL